jgi:hypothetical protein
MKGGAVVEALICQFDEIGNMIGGYIRKEFQGDVTKFGSNHSYSRFHNSDLLFAGSREVIIMFQELEETGVQLREGLRTRLWES